MQRYQKQLQQWLKNGEPDIITYMDISTAQETVERLSRFPDACNDDYISTLIKILSEEIDASLNLSGLSTYEPDF